MKQEVHADLILGYTACLSPPGLDCLTEANFGLETLDFPLHLLLSQ